MSDRLIHGRPTMFNTQFSTLAQFSMRCKAEPRIRMTYVPNAQSDHERRGTACRDGVVSTSCQCGHITSVTVPGDFPSYSLAFAHLDRAHFIHADSSQLRGV